MQFPGFLSPSFSFSFFHFVIEWLVSGSLVSRCTHLVCSLSAGANWLRIQWRWPARRRPTGSAAEKEKLKGAKKIKFPFYHWRKIKLPQPRTPLSTPRPCWDGAFAFDIHLIRVRSIDDHNSINLRNKVESRSLASTFAAVKLILVPPPPLQ